MEFTVPFLLKSKKYLGVSRKHLKSTHSSSSQGTDFTFVILSKITLILFIFFFKIISM